MQTESRDMQNEMAAIRERLVHPLSIRQKRSGTNPISHWSSSFVRLGLDHQEGALYVQLEKIDFQHDGESPSFLTEHLPDHVCQSAIRAEQPGNSDCNRRLQWRWQAGCGSTQRSRRDGQQSAEQWRLHGCF